MIIIKTKYLLEECVRSGKPDSTTTAVMTADDEYDKDNDDDDDDDDGGMRRLAAVQQEQRPKIDGYSDKYLATARREGEKCCGGDDADYAAVLVY